MASVTPAQMRWHMKRALRHPEADIRPTNPSDGRLWKPVYGAWLAEVAQRHGLIPCGGSDYHCLGNTGEALPGTLGPPLETVERLEEAARELSRSSR